MRATPAVRTRVEARAARVMAGRECLNLGKKSRYCWRVFVHLRQLTSPSKHSKSAASDFPVLSYPIQTSDEIKARLAHLVALAKTQWLDNPKNVVFAYVQSRTGSYPEFRFAEGRYHGKSHKVIRSTLVIDEEYNIVATGDGKSQKEAEKAAALHGVLLLLERDFIAHPPPGIFGSGGKGNSKVLTAALFDGTSVSLEQAREFIDFFCREGHFGSPDVVFHEAHEVRGRRVLIHGWKATMCIGGTPVGESLESNKKTAQNAAYLNTATTLADEYRDMWVKYLQMPRSKLAGKAPPVYFRVSNELEEKMRHLYDTIRDSELYANRPRTTAVLSSPPDATPATKKADATRHALSDEQHEQKSQQMLENLNAYQTDERVKSLRIAREQLPVMQHAGDILVKTELNPITVCMASTGSGKTTQVPQILLDDFTLRKQGSRCNIICTQPRRIAAISVAQRVAKERGESVGDSVGYQVRFDSKMPKPDGSILFCTTGVFLRRLQSALEDASGTSFLDNVTHILMDEVHERDVETDLLLAVIKRVLQDRRERGCPEIKLLLMSATVDPKLFQQYFEGFSARPVPVVEIPGRSFPVQKYYFDEIYQQLQELALPLNQGGWVWHEQSVRDYVHREIIEHGGRISDSVGSSDDKLIIDNLELPYPLVALLIAYVLTRSRDGHVLVFLPGWDEIKIVHQLLLNSKEYPLMGVCFDDSSQYEIHILHSSVPVTDQQAVFEPVRHPHIRRVILSTNIAETSVTIPDVVYVIDTGRVKEKRYDPERHLSSLVSAWVGTSNLNQRAGRAGRHRSGEYYGLLSMARYNRLGVSQTVEMKRLDLSNVVMHIKALNIPGMEVEDVLASTIEPPASERVQAAMVDLGRIGALDYHSNLTSLGKMLLHLPVDVNIGKMCLYGAFFRCLDPVLSLAAILTNRDPFMAPIHLKREANEIKNSWCPTTFRSDPLCVLNAYYEWNRLLSLHPSQANRFLYQNMLSRSTMFQIQQVKENLFQSLRKANVIQLIRSSAGVPPRYRRRIRETDPEFNANAHSTALLASLIAVSSPNFAVRTGERTFRTSQDKSCFIHPSSVCSAKFQKDKAKMSASPSMPNKDIYAFAEKVRNTSQMTGSAGHAMTFMRTCTRIDPLSYMLFGATEARASPQGLDCDSWLPVTGDYDALDGVERIKSVMDACILRVLEGVQIPLTNLTAKKSSIEPVASDVLNDTFSDDEEDADPTIPPVGPLTMHEVQELESLTSRIVDLLDHYASENPLS